MKILCRIGAHSWIKTKQEVETRKKDTGAAIETIKEKFNHYKCKKCGKTKKELNRYVDARTSYVKDREVINREWKNRQNDTE